MINISISRHNNYLTYLILISICMVSLVTISVASGYLGMYLTENVFDSNVIKQISKNEHEISKYGSYAILSSERERRDFYVGKIEEISGIRKAEILDTTLQPITNVEVATEWDFVELASNSKNTAILEKRDDVLVIGYRIGLSNLLTERTLVEDEILFGADRSEVEFHSKEEIQGYAILYFDRTAVLDSSDRVSNFVFLVISSSIVLFSGVILTIAVFFSRVIKKQNKELLDKNMELLSANKKSEKIVARNRALVRDLDKAIEIDKQYVSGEIHDSLCTALTKVMRENELFLAADNFSKNVVVSHVENNVNQLRGVGAVARNIIRRLRTEVTGFLGLEEGIKDIVSQFDEEQEHTDFFVDISSERIGAVNSEDFQTVISIVQEALQNICNHANAKSVSVAVFDDVGKLHIRIKDDGDGFVTSGSDEKEYHFGLALMEERALKLGGKVTVDSEVNNGTVVTLTI